MTDLHKQAIMAAAWLADKPAGEEFKWTGLLWDIVTLNHTRTVGCADAWTDEQVTSYAKSLGWSGE